MMPELPVDLPGNPLSDQLIWVATWAGIDPAPLLIKEAEIAEVFNKGSSIGVKKLKECLPDAPWNWPAYQSMITAAISDSQQSTADDVRFFSRDELTDMAQYVYDKLRSRYMALYRFRQMDAVKHLRPFLQLRGTCAGAGGRKTLMANDPTWKTHCLPWQCSRLLCRCQAHSLSRPELKRYVEGGCDAGDEAAAELTYN